MSVTIGRASLDDLYDLRVRGSRVSFRTDIEGSDVYEMKALRQQLAGLADNRDEEVVPFTWSEDATLDGFYRVVGTSVGSSAVMLSTGFVPEVDVELEQIPGFAKPTWETTTSSVVRANVHGITSGTAPSSVVGSFVSAPTWSVDADWMPSGFTIISRPVQSGVGGGGGAYLGHQIILSFGPQTLTSFRVNGPAANFYDWGCQVEIEWTSGVWYPVVGRDVPQDARWRISNGLVRLTSAKSGTPGTIEMWDGTGWESRNVTHWDASAPTFGIGEPQTGYFGSLAILRNSHEQVTVQTTGYFRTTTYSVARGCHHVEYTNYSRAGSWLGIGLDSSHAAACTAITGGLRATSNDANGNRVVFGMADTFSSSTANGGIWSSGATSDRANAGFVGFELNGSGAAARNTAQEIAYNFYAPAALRQRVVVR